MELGQRIRQARLEAEMSQRQLCGDVITRNMLSQIENGSAKPSMGTLQYIAAKLGKPIGYFLGEALPVPHNQQILQQARQASGTQVLKLLENYQDPDPVYDPERWLLEALTCLDLAKQAVEEKKTAYAISLLERAGAAGKKTPYYHEQTERSRLLLCFAAGMRVPAQALPAIEPELLLRGQAALDSGDAALAGRILDGATDRSPQWYFLRGTAFEAEKNYAQAAEQYLQAVEYEPMKVYGCLERCYKALDDYKEAYRYACLQR